MGYGLVTEMLWRECAWDNGVGIDPAYRKVCGLFDKLDQNTGGAGLGLTITWRQRRLVENSPRAEIACVLTAAHLGNLATVNQNSVMDWMTWMNCFSSAGLTT